ncbi:MAG: metallophosphoesterase [Candidatus Anstonellales archaeon]
MKVRDIILDPTGAAVLDDYLLIADPHIGIENSLGLRRGSNTDRVLNSLKGLNSKYGTENLVIVGDIKHGFNLKDRDLLISFLRRTNQIFKNTYVVEGNHDNGLNLIIPTNSLEYFEYKEYIILHGHRSVDTDKFMIIGHEHPVIELSNGFRSSRYICFLEFDMVLVMPAFNNISPGNDVIISKFSSEILTKLDRWKAKVYISDDSEVLYAGRLGDLARKIYGEIPEI